VDWLYERAEMEMMDKNIKLADKYDPAEDCALGSIAMDDKKLLRKDGYLVNHLQEVSHEHKGQNVPVKLAKQLLVVHCNLTYYLPLQSNRNDG
jgi:hypothetical protein